MSTLSYTFLVQKISAAFDGVYDFHSWEISHKFMIAFMKYGVSSGNEKAQIEIEIFKALCNIQNIFYSAVNDSLH